MSELKRNQIGTFNLSDLSDTVISTPTAGYIPAWNGSAWNASPQATVSGRSGMNFYLDNTGITAASDQNFYAIKTLSKTPVVATAEQPVIVTITNTTVPLNVYLFNSALGKASFDAGQWVLGTYASIDSLTGSGTAEIITSVKRAVPYSGGIVATTSGSGTTRQLDVSGASPFDGSEYNANITLAGYIQTPKGNYQITAVISGATIQIAVPSTYTNESNVAFSIWRQAFNLTTGNITTTTLTLYPIPYPKAAITTLTTDEIAIIVFAKTTYAAAKTIEYTSNGTTHNSYISTPLINPNFYDTVTVSNSNNNGVASFYTDSSAGLIGYLNFQSNTGAATLNIDANPLSVASASTINYGSLTTASSITHNLYGIANVISGSTSIWTMSAANANYTQMTVNSTGAAVVSQLCFQAAGVEKWFLSSANTYTTPNNRFSIIHKYGATYPEYLTILDDGTINVPGAFNSAISLGLQATAAITNPAATCGKFYIASNSYLKYIYMDSNGVTLWSPFYTTIGGNFYVAGSFNAASTITATVSSVTYGLQINATNGLCVFGINQNNASLFYTGLNVQRQGVEKWFIGMDDSTNNLIFRLTASSNPVYIDTTGKLFASAFSCTGFTCSGSPVIALASAIYWSNTAGGTDGDVRTILVAGKPHVQIRVAGTYTDTAWNL